MEEEIVSPQMQEGIQDAPVENLAEQMAQDVVDEMATTGKEPEEQKVPLSALQKMRKRAQEAELRAKWLEEQHAKQSAVKQEEDTSRYESATKEDLSKTQQEIVRIVEEKRWIKENPEKYEKVNEYLPEFLKQRPNLALAIDSAANRYEEAFALMEALTPRQQPSFKQPIPKKDAPGAPTSIPKAAALNQAVDVMTMSDAEFHKWRQAQRRRR